MRKLIIREDSTHIRIDTNNPKGRTIISFSKITGFGTVLPKTPVLEGRYKVCEVYGIFGSLTLQSGTYLICVDHAVHVGRLKVFDVYEAKKFRILKIKTVDEDTNDDFELSLIHKLLSLPGLYFSEYALFKSCEDQSAEGFEFLFNFSLLSEFNSLVRGDCTPFIVRCIQGYFGIEDIGNISIALISRRCWKRVGVRFFSRGCNNKGYPSNFVETEQIVYSGDNVTSFVQVRGSIPLKWRHKVGLKYEPPIFIDKDEEVVVKADAILRKRYKEVFYLNLIRHEAYEKVLNDFYGLAMSKHQFRFKNFDYKKQGLDDDEIARERFIADLAGIIQEHGCFVKRHAGQGGVIRTNCIDCLDRSNVVQFLLAKASFSNQVNVLSQFQPTENLYKESLRKLWYNNGNMLSIQYAGTPALKSAVVHGGGQSFIGRMRDMYYSLKRYYINRFSHGDLQTSYDLITGNYMNMKKRRCVKHLYRIEYTSLVTLFIMVYSLLYYNGVGAKAIFALNLVVSVAFLSLFILFPDTFINHPLYFDDS
jgi:hypothetical protein